MDAVVDPPLAEGGQQPAMELAAGRQVGHQLRRAAVEPIDLGMLTFQQPLTEILEAGNPGGAVAREDLARARGGGVLAVGRRAAQAENPAGPERRTVGEQVLDLACQVLPGAGDRLGGNAVCGRHRNLERQLETGPAARRQVSLRMLRDPLLHRPGQSLHRLGQEIAGLPAPSRHLGPSPGLQEMSIDFSSSIIPRTTSKPPCQKAASVTSMPSSFRIVTGRAEPP